MPTDIQAITIQRRWGDWLSQHGLMCLRPDERERLLDAARRKKRESGKARCFEHTAVSYADFERAVTSALRKLDLIVFVAVVGEPEAPAVASIQLEQVPLLLRGTANARSTLALVNAETADSIVLDGPDPDSGPGEMLVSAGGVFQRVIEQLMVTLKGGAEFLGN